MAQQLQGRARSPQIDALRGIAILLVIGRHLEISLSGKSALLDTILNSLQRGGWMGVDLFFVLSGFLVSGLLFEEQIQKGKADIPRFLLRRGLKIYPAFYLFIALSILSVWLRGKPIAWKETAFELLFIQNYLGGLWGHTWSLAIEEHFYLLLALLVLFRSGRERSGLPWPKIFLITSGTLLALRILTCLHLPYSADTHVKPSHLRLDSLLLGVVLSYYYHFDRARLEAVYLRYRPSLLVLGLGFLMLPFFFELETTLWMPSIGFSLLALGGGVFVLEAALIPRLASSSIVRALSWIGFYSYSIYLWHFHSRYFTLLILNRLGVSAEQYPWSTFFFYALSSISLGALMAKCIEQPVLRLRDRLFPSSLATPRKILSA